MGTLAPATTSIINRSLHSGTMPEMLEGALVLPMLKKPWLDTKELNIFRLVSNLTYISKVIERVEAAKLDEHLVTNSSNKAHQLEYH